ncbi:hypothetical protein lerEdw1_004094 [Lerista edwardsae]|nr:hypothetical protein lerEdw1_004094 [Lerista edwardsae]
MLRMGARGCWGPCASQHQGPQQGSLVPGGVATGTVHGARRSVGELRGKWKAIKMAFHAKLDHRKRHRLWHQDVLLDIPIWRPPGTDDTPPYHTHWKDGVLICDNFLLGHCPLQKQCPCHHTPFPYHWQWRFQGDRTWTCFSLSVQHHLERLYCGTKFTKVQLRNRTNHSQVLDLDAMKLTSSQEIRRLSNSSDHACNPYFPAELKVYWKEIYKWIEYKEPVAQELVAAFEKGKWNHAFCLHERLYNVNLKCMTQWNIKTGFTRPIKFRPVLRSYPFIAPYLRSVAQPRHTAAIHGEDPMDLYCGPYPAARVPPPQGDSVFTMAEVAVAEMAYYVVSKLFHTSLPEDKALILAIYRVRNDHIWQAYMRQKEIMSRDRALGDQRTLEQHLFHGTGAAQIKSICTMNFNPHLAGKHGAFYGKGIYFAKDAAYSHDYASATETNERHMFLAKVLTGYWQLGKSRLKRPPRRHDSCTDNLCHPSIFVIFRSCQCYPYFLIRYKEVNTAVFIDM